MKDKDVKDLVEKIIGYDITRESEKEVTEKIFWVEFEHAPAFRIRQGVYWRSFELIAEGHTEPTHIIPERAIYSIRHGAEVFIYPCGDCIEELKNKPPNLEGFPHKGTENEKINWALNNLEKIKPPMPPSYMIGHSIVLRTKLDDGMIRREVYCTNPHSTHNLVEIIHSSPTTARKENE